MKISVDNITIEIDNYNDCLSAMEGFLKILPAVYGRHLDFGGMMESLDSCLEPEDSVISYHRREGLRLGRDALIHELEAQGIIVTESSGGIKVSFENPETMQWDGE